MKTESAIKRLLVVFEKEKNISFCESVSISLVGLPESDGILRLLTHVGFLRQNGLILSEVFLCVRRSKNHEK